MNTSFRTWLCMCVPHITNYAPLQNTSPLTPGVCPGVCVASRISSYCEAALDVPGLCKNTLRCCVPHKLYEGKDSVPEEFVLLRGPSKTAQKKKDPVQIVELVSGNNVHRYLYLIQLMNKFVKLLPMLRQYFDICSVIFLLWRFAALAINLFMEYETYVIKIKYILWECDFM